MSFALGPTLALLLALAPQAQTPSPERVRAAVEALQAGLRSPKPALRVAAVQAEGAVDAPEVASALAVGLADADESVRVEVIDALGRLRQPTALEALLEFHKQQRRELRKQPKVLPRLLQAIARRGDERAVAVLTDDVPAQLAQATLRARLLGLGNVRSASAIEGLFKVMQAIGFAEQQQHMEDFRLSMLLLSGVDHGRSLESWITWWEASREGFAPSKEVPKLAAADWERWCTYWGIPSARPAR